MARINKPNKIKINGNAINASIISNNNLFCPKILQLLFQINNLIYLKLSLSVTHKMIKSI